MALSIVRTPARPVAESAVAAALDGRFDEGRAGTTPVWATIARVDLVSLVRAAQEAGVSAPWIETASDAADLAATLRDLPPWRSELSWGVVSSEGLAHVARAGWEWLDDRARGGDRAPELARRFHAQCDVAMLPRPYRPTEELNDALRTLMVTALLNVGDLVGAGGGELHLDTVDGEYAVVLRRQDAGGNGRPLLRLPAGTAADMGRLVACGAFLGAQVEVVASYWAGVHGELVRENPHLILGSATADGVPFADVRTCHEVAAAAERALADVRDGTSNGGSRPSVAARVVGLRDVASALAVYRRLSEADAPGQYQAPVAMPVLLDPASAGPHAGRSREARVVGQEVLRAHEAAAGFAAFSPTPGSVAAKVLASIPVGDAATTKVRLEEVTGVWSAVVVARPYGSAELSDVVAVPVGASLTRAHLERFARASAVGTIPLARYSPSDESPWLTVPPPVPGVVWEWQPRNDGSSRLARVHPLPERGHSLGPLVSRLVAERFPDPKDGFSYWDQCVSSTPDHGRRTQREATLVSAYAGCHVSESSSPGAYYVSAQHRDRKALLAGPYPTLRGALEHLFEARGIAYDVDPRAGFYEFGTARFTGDGPPPQGRLNNRMMEPPGPTSVDVPVPGPEPGPRVRL
jgi:hypothetical protein